MSFWGGFYKQALLRKGVELQPQQSRTANKMKQNGGVLAYHGLGSGKTLTSLAATQGKKTDVIVPAALRGNYAKEVKKFTTGHKPNIMSYEKATKMDEPQGEAVILDEAHAIGRHDSARSRHIEALASRYPQRMLATATPIRNHPSEIAPLMNVVRGDKAFPTDPQKFSDKFIKEEQVQPGFIAKVLHGAKPGVRYRIKNEKEFAELAKGYVDYYAPSAEHFPSMSHEVIETPMSDEQMKYYKFVMGKANPALKWKIKMGLPPSKTEAKQLNSFLSGARQISNSTAAFGGKGDSTKITKAVSEFQEHMKKSKNFKGVVYSNFLDSGVKNYAKQLEAKKIPYAIFDGSLSDSKRKKIVDDYNNGKIKALLITGAGAQGIDLKGTRLMQLLEPHWNNPRLEQATGRTARYMSHSHLPIDERHVHVQRFHSTIPKTFLQKLTGGKQDKSVDQYLDMLSKDKEKLNNQFLDVLKRVGSDSKVETVK